MFRHPIRPCLIFRALRTAPSGTRRFPSTHALTCDLRPLSHPHYSLLTTHYWLDLHASSSNRVSCYIHPHSVPPLFTLEGPEIFPSFASHPQMSSDPNRAGQYPPPPSPWENHPPYPQRPEYAVSNGCSGIASCWQNLTGCDLQEPSDLRNHPSSIPRTDMVTLQPQLQQDIYALPPPRSMYQGHPQDPYRGGPPQHINFNQPAPRQRTAIACRYCRRRKVIRPCHFPLLPLSETDDARSVVPASKLRRMGAARIASASSKNASSRPSPLKRKPLCPRTPPIHTSATRAGCHRSVAAGPSIRNKGHQSSTGRTANLWVQCHLIRIPTFLKAIPIPPSRTKRRAQCMMIEVARPLTHMIK